MFAISFIKESVSFLEKAFIEKRDLILYISALDFYLQNELFTIRLFDLQI